MRVAQAAQEQIVSDAPVDNGESTTTKPAPTLPKLKQTAQVVRTRGTAAGKGNPSSSKRQAKEKAKKSDKAEATDDEESCVCCLLSKLDFGQKATNTRQERHYMQTLK